MTTKNGSSLREEIGQALRRDEILLQYFRGSGIAIGKPVGWILQNGVSRPNAARFADHLLQAPAPGLAPAAAHRGAKDQPFQAPGSPRYVWRICGNGKRVPDERRIRSRVIESHE